MTFSEHQTEHPINYTKKYFGDVRDGAWASATDYVTYTVNIYKYDFITDETILFDSFEWKGRVVRGWPSRGRGEAYRDDKEPPHRMNIDDKGHICIDSKIIIE